VPFSDRGEKSCDADADADVDADASAGRLAGDFKSSEITALLWTTTAS